jgi:hypothetical protein
MKAFILSIVAMIIIGVGANLVLSNMSTWSSQENYSSNAVRIN